MSVLERLFGTDNDENTRLGRWFFRFGGKSTTVLEIICYFRYREISIFSVILRFSMPLCYLCFIFWHHFLFLSIFWKRFEQERASWFQILLIRALTCVHCLNLSQCVCRRDLILSSPIFETIHFYLQTRDSLILKIQPANLSSSMTCRKGVFGLDSSALCKMLVIEFVSLT